MISSATLRLSCRASLPPSPFLQAERALPPMCGWPCPSLSRPSRPPRPPSAARRLSGPYPMWVSVELPPVLLQCGCTIGIDLGGADNAFTCPATQNVTDLQWQTAARFALYCTNDGTDVSCAGAWIFLTCTSAHRGLDLPQMRLSSPAPDPPFTCPPPPPHTHTHPAPHPPPTPLEQVPITNYLTSASHNATATTMAQLAEESAASSSSAQEGESAAARAGTPGRGGGGAGWRQAPP